MNSLARFEARLAGDETKLQRDESRDEARLQRDQDGLSAFASKLGLPDERLASNSPLGLGANFFSQNNSGIPNSDMGGPPSAPPQAADFRTQLMAASGGPAPSGPVPLPNAVVPQQQVDMSGMSGGPAPVVSLSGGQGRLSPGQIDQRFAGNGASNVDLSGMTSPGGMAPSPPPPSRPVEQQTQPQWPQARYIAGHHQADLVPDTKGTIAQRFRNEADRGANDQELMNAERNQAKIVANNLQKQANDAEDRMLHRQVQEDQRQAYVAQRSAKLDKLIEDTANSKEDPNRVFNSADTGTKIALGIGAFFGGLIPGVKPLMSMLGGNIDRDVEAQRQDKAGRQKGIEQARAGLEGMRHDFDDQRSNELAKEAQAWTIAEQQIKAQMARTNDPIMKAKGEQLLLASRDRNTAIKQEYDRLSYVRPQVIGGGVAGGGAGTQGKGLVVKLPDGRQVLAPNELKFNELTAKSAGIGNIQANIDRALNIRKNASAIEMANPYSTVRKQLESIKAETSQLATVLRGQGAMSKGDQEVADHAMGAMDGFLDNNNDVLSATRSRLGEQLTREADALGAEHVQTGYQVDQHGRLQRDVALTGESDKPRPNMPKGKPLR